MLFQLALYARCQLLKKMTTPARNLGRYLLTYVESYPSEIMREILARHLNYEPRISQTIDEECQSSGTGRERAFYRCRTAKHLHEGRLPLARYGLQLSARNRLIDVNALVNMLVVRRELVQVVRLG